MGAFVSRCVLEGFDALLQIVENERTGKMLAKVRAELAIPLLFPFRVKILHESLHAEFMNEFIQQRGDRESTCSCPVSVDTVISAGCSGRGAI